MRTITTVIVLALLGTVSTLTVEGNWQLVAVQSSSVTVPATIEEFIYKESEIMKRITIHTCNSLQYEVSIEGDNFWIDTDSEKINLLANCSASEVKLATDIREAIRSVLTFEIKVNKLVLYNPSLEPQLLFQRQSSNLSKSITGSWMMNFASDDGTTYVLVADDSTISVCNGASFKYTLIPPFGISIKVQTAATCSPAVLSSISQAAFFKINEGVLQIYDSTVNKIASGVYSPTTTPPPSVLANAAQPSQQSGISTGKYILLLLFRRDLMRIILPVTNSTITLTLCNRLVFNYSLGPSSSISITSSSVPNPKCSKVDETIYFNYFTSASTYAIDSSGVITLSDSNNKAVISLSPP